MNSGLVQGLSSAPLRTRTARAMNGTTVISSTSGMSSAGIVLIGSPGAVDGFTFANSAAGNAGVVSVKATGPDTNIGLKIYGKGGANGGGTWIFDDPTARSAGAFIKVINDDNTAAGGFGAGVAIARSDAAFAVHFDFSTTSASAGPVFWTADGTGWLGGPTKRWGRLYLDGTITAAGTTGAQTINKQRGTVRFAAGATTLVVTNSLVTATSKVIAHGIGAFDATATIFQCTSASGSFTITANAVVTAEIEVFFDVVIP